MTTAIKALDELLEVEKQKRQQSLGVIEREKGNIQQSEVAIIELELAIEKLERRDD